VRTAEGASLVYVQEIRQLTEEAMADLRPRVEARLLAEKGSKAVADLVGRLESESDTSLSPEYQRFLE
jgi:hypothetical protein